MVVLSKYVRDHFVKAVKKIKAEFPFMRYRFVTARAVKMLKDEEEKLKKMTEGKGSK